MLSHAIIYILYILYIKSIKRGLAMGSYFDISRIILENAKSRTFSFTPSSTSGDDFGNIDVKENKVPKLDEETESKVKEMAKKAYPSINWDELSDYDKQSLAQQYSDGTLAKKYEEREEQLAQFRAKIKSLPPKEGAKYLLETLTAMLDPNFKDIKDQSKRDEKVIETSLGVLQQLHPELDISKIDKKGKKSILERYGFDIETCCWALKTGKIEKLQDIEKFTPEQIKDLEFEYAQDVIENIDPKTKDSKEHRALNMTYNTGKLERDIVEANKDSDLTLEELRKSDKYSKLMYEYLNNKTERSDFEEMQLDALKYFTKIYGEKGLEGIKVTDECSVTETFLHKVSDGKEVDWKDPIAIEKLQKAMKDELAKCETPEDRVACMNEMLKATNTAEALTLATHLCLLQKEGIISADDLKRFYVENSPVIDGLKKVADSCVNRTHAVVACSHHLSAEGQVATAEHVASHCQGENAQFSKEQVQGYTKNMIPQYEASVQTETVGIVTATGMVDEVLGETYAKLDEAAAKEAYEQVMNSDSISAERKALIARDTIDYANESSKSYYQDLANSLGIDYSSVPPKSERTQNSSTSSTTESNSSNNNKTNQPPLTNADRDFIQVINNNGFQQNPIQVLLDGLKEAGEVVMGKTPDKQEVITINSLDSATKELKKGTPFAKVFSKCSDPIKKQIVKCILQSNQKEEAVKNLLSNGIPLEELLKYAPTAQSKDEITKYAKKVHESGVIAQVRACEKKTQEGFEVKKA